MKIVYIPQHLYLALKKADLRSQDFRDVEKLLSIISADDVAFYFYANDPRYCPIPKPLTETLDNLIWGPDEGMPFTDSDQSKKTLGTLNSLRVNGTSAEMYEEGAVLTSDCMEEDLIIVTHTAPADAGVRDGTKSSETTFYDRIIQQLLAFQPLEVVMGSPILLGWLKSVQANAKTPVA